MESIDEILPEVEVRVLRSVDELDDGVPLFVLRQEEIDGFLSSLVHDGGVTDKSRTSLRDLIISTHTQPLRKEGAEVLISNLSPTVVKLWAPGTKKDYETNGFPIVPADMPYAAEQRTRDVDANPIAFNEAPNKTLEVAHEVLISTNPISACRLPIGNDIGLVGYVIGKAGTKTKTELESWDSKNASIWDALKTTDAKLVFVPKSDLNKLELAKQTDEVYENIAKLMLEDSERDTGLSTDFKEMYRVLARVSEEVDKEPIKKEIVNNSKWSLSATLYKDKETKLPKFLKPLEEEDIAIWKRFSYAGPDVITKSAKIHRKLAIDKLSEEFVVDGGDFLEQYAVMNTQEDDEDDSNFEQVKTPTVFRLKDRILWPMQDKVYETLTWLASSIRSPIRPAEGGDETVATLFENAFFGMHWINEVEFLKEKLPDLSADAIASILRNEKIAFTKDSQQVLEELNLLRNKFLQTVLLRLITSWSVHIHLDILLQQGTSSAYDGTWSIYGFPIRKDDKGLIDRVAEILHTGGKLPIPYTKADLLQNEMHRIWKELYEEDYHDKIKAIAKTVKMEKEAQKDRLHKTLKQLKIAENSFINTKNITNAGVLAVELMESLRLVPTILQLEKVSSKTGSYPGVSLTKVGHDWKAYMDLIIPSKTILKQLMDILSTLSVSKRTNSLGSQSMPIKKVRVAYPLKLRRQEQEQEQSSSKSKIGVEPIPNPKEVSKIVFPVEIPGVQVLEKETEKMFVKVVGVKAARDWMKFFLDGDWRMIFRSSTKIPIVIKKEANEVSAIFAEGPYKDDLKAIIVQLGSWIAQVRVGMGLVQTTDRTLHWSFAYFIGKCLQFVKESFENTPMKVIWPSISKGLLEESNVSMEWDRTTIQDKLARLREQEKSKTLEYLDKLNDTDKAIVRELKQLGIESYADMIDKEASEQRKNRMGVDGATGGDDYDGGGEEVIATGQDED